MKIKMIVYSAITASLLVGCATEQQKQAKLEAQAKVTRSDAEKTALAKVPGGTVKDGEIEKENGKLIWSLDLNTAGTKDITEVNVNAMTGDIVNIEHESAGDETKEKD